MARPADQVISLAVEKDVKEGAAGEDGALDVAGLAGEVEADRVEYSEEDEEARIGGMVLEATKSGVVAVLDLMRKEAENAMFQWWCADAIASLCAGNGEFAVYVLCRNAGVGCMAGCGAARGLVRVCAPVWRADSDGMRRCL